MAKKVLNNNQKKRREIDKNIRSMDLLGEYASNFAVIGIIPRELKRVGADETGTYRLDVIDPDKFIVGEEGVVKATWTEDLFQNIKDVSDALYKKAIDHKFIFLSPDTHNVMYELSHSEFDIFKSYATPERLGLEQPSLKK